MLAWLLDAIASGLARLYGRPLGHDVAVVFLVAFVVTIIVAARWSRPGSSGVTAALGVPLMSPSGAVRLLGVTTTMLRGSDPAKAMAFAILALVVAGLISLFPLAVGASLVAQGELARGVIYTLLGYLWIWVFLGLLPIWLVVGWYEYGFWQSLLGNGLMFLVLSSPEWLMTRAHRAASLPLLLAARAQRPDRALLPAPARPDLVDDDPLLRRPRGRGLAADGAAGALGVEPPVGNPLRAGARGRARRLVTWGAPTPAPTPPDVRSAPGNPWRSSILLAAA